MSEVNEAEPGKQDTVTVSIFSTSVDTYDISRIRPEDVAEYKKLGLQEFVIPRYVYETYTSALANLHEAEALLEGFLP